MNNSFIVPEKGKIEYVIGIDFGHGETSAAICRIDSNNDPEDIDMTGTGKKTIPSTLYIETNEGQEDVYIGYDAIAIYERGGGGSFYAYFKQSIEEYNETRIPSMKVMRLFMSEVYKAICHKRSGELMEGDRIKQNHVVFIACPSQSQKWGKQAMQNYVRLALDAGLPIAGVTIEDKFSMFGIVRESRAAYIRMLQKEEASQKALKGILVIDYGSSTIDITYYKEGEKPIDKGYSIGASRVEQNIQDFLKEYHDDLGEDQNPDALKLIERDYPNINTGCLYRIRFAKEVFYGLYSGANCIQVAYKFPPRINAKKIDVEIPKETINNKILTKYIKEVESAFEDFRDKVINNSKVTLMVLTGGASSMNFVETTAKLVFGNDVVLLPPQDQSLTVSNGIATAGRADVRLYHMAKGLLSDSRITSPNVFDDIISDASADIANDVITDMHYYYESFKDQYSDESVASLKDSIASKLKNNNSSYQRHIQVSFNYKLKNYINNNAKPTLIEYVKENFPTFNLSQIKSKEVQNVSINISDSTLDTLNKAAEDSAKQIEDNSLVIAVKIIWDVAALAFAAAAKIELEIIAGARNLGARVWALLKGEKYNEKKDMKAPTYDEILDELVADINDKDTKLNKDKRAKVYKAFNDNKTSYQNTLKGDISYKLKWDSDLKSKINKTCESVVVQYVVEEIADIQRQIR